MQGKVSLLGKLRFFYPKDWQNQTQIWLGLSLAIAILYSLPALQQAFAAEYIVQDDARQHVFWMQRFIDPGWFPDDLLADYFQSVAPGGYKALYWLGAQVGLAPLTFNRLLPVGLNLILTGYCFGVTLQLLPIPLAGFVTALLLNQNLLLRDDVVSATPAAFIYPLLLAFLYYLLRRSLGPCLLSILLLGLFYPQGVLLVVAVLLLRLLHWQNGRLRLQAKNYALCGWGLLVAVLVLLPYELNPSPYGPVLTLDQAQTMPALFKGGWSHFFDPDFGSYWLCGKRSGFLPVEWCDAKLLLPQIWLAVCLPVVWLRRRSPLAKQWVLLGQVLAASVGLFAIAHLLLFRLHLPSRYSEHSLRIVAAIAAGLAVAEWLRRSFPLSRRSWAVFTAGLTFWAIAPLIVYFAFLIPVAPVGNYVRGESPQLYQFFQSQPQAIRIASLTTETNNLPSFAQRSIYVGGEGYTLPYHLGYYSQVRQRTIDLINAQYTPDSDELKRFLDQSQVDFWLLDPAAFSLDWVQHSRWLKQYGEVTLPQQVLQSGASPALAQSRDRCTVFKTAQWLVLAADCVRAAW
ncbi:hypothetical protein [Almyronema epifaneia]|uniref:Glycosyltransferase RgtA/B/C/D-like domain-containing protein n=1 Tax=Almyronema epifaneia S1 TaxID=2991925 RepID=A0ABW6IGK8_9CYAN